MGVIFTWQGFSKDAARIQQRSSKADFGQNYAFGSLMTPIYGAAFPRDNTLRRLTPRQSRLYKGP